MDKDLQQVKERIIDAIELFELAEEVYFGNRHAPLGIDEVSEDGIHYHLECPLCARSVCCALDIDKEGEVSTVFVALWDDGIPFICETEEGESSVVTFWRG